MKTKTLLRMHFVMRFINLFLFPKVVIPVNAFVTLFSIWAITILLYHAPERALGWIGIYLLSVTTLAYGIHWQDSGRWERTDKTFREVVSITALNKIPSIREGYPNEEPEKIFCEDCYWTGYSDQMLTAKNPFNLEEDIQACPSCKEVNDTLLIACDEPGCWRQSVSGTPTKEGYRWTCYEHSPDRVANET